MVKELCRTYNIDIEKIRRGQKKMVRERVFESRLALKIGKNPDLAKRFGLQISLAETDKPPMDLDKRINNQSATSSTEAKMINF